MTPNMAGELNTSCQLNHTHEEAGSRPKLSSDRSDSQLQSNTQGLAAVLNSQCISVHTNSSLQQFTMQASEESTEDQVNSCAPEQQVNPTGHPDNPVDPVVSFQNRVDRFMTKHLDLYDRLIYDYDEKEYERFIISDRTSKPPIRTVTGINYINQSINQSMA